MDSKKIIIFGSSQLAFKTRDLLKEKKYKVDLVPSQQFEKVEDSMSESSKFEKIKKLILQHDLNKVKAVCVLDEKDSRNIELTLALLSISEKIPMYVSLINASLSRYFKKNHENLHIFDPVSIAAPVFIEAFEQEKNKPRTEEVNVEKFDKRPRFKIDKIIMGLSILILAFFMTSVVFFHLKHNLSWLDSAYFTSAIITTVGYGDINLKDAMPDVKIFGIFFSLASYALVWLLISFIINSFIKKRYDVELGRKKHHMKNHIIICGIGKISRDITRHMTLKKQKVIGIEMNKDNRFLNMLREEGTPILVGDSTIPENLIDAGIEKAKAVFVMINDDLKSLEVGLNAKSLNPNIPIIIRTMDETLAEKIRTKLNIPYAFSTTKIAADHILKEIEILNIKNNTPTPTE